MSKNSNKMLAFKNKYRFIMCSAMITISNFSDAYEQRLHLLISGCYSRCMDMRVLQRGSSFGAGFPIGASSIPVGTRFSVGKSSVLYLCFRLMPGRGCLRHLQPGQMGSGQTLFGGSRAGGFCTIADETGICTQGKIRLTEKGSKGISTPRPAAATAH